MPLVQAKLNVSGLWLWPDSCTVLLLSGLFPALLQEDPGVHQAGSFIFLSKSSFPGTHDSPNLCQMNVAAEIEMYLCYVSDWMQAQHLRTQPSSHSYQLLDGAPMELDWSWPLDMFFSLQALGMPSLSIFQGTVGSVRAFEIPRLQALVLCGSPLRERPESWLH